jgi:hypothetical protein
MRRFVMRKRSLAAASLLAVAIGVIRATPALATYSLGSILFPNGSTTFYSPFSGPATVRINFDDAGAGLDPPATITFKLRVQNGPTIHTESVNINPDPDDTPMTFPFVWPAVSVTTTTTYEVAAYKGGDELGHRAFTLRPHLVRIKSISPNPFFPWIADNYRDTTDIAYSLQASSNPVVIRMYASDPSGDCCGTQVRQVTIDNVIVGSDRHYIWNGRDGGGDLLPKGRYWVRVTATSFGGVTQSSAFEPVAIARFHRVNRSISKNGIAYHHRSAITVHRSGGTCGVAKLASSKDVRVVCRDASVRVYWRWNLPSTGRIEAVGFVMIGVPGLSCGATKGHTTTDTFLRVGGVGRFGCRVDKAKLTYSFLKAS